MVGEFTISRPRGRKEESVEINLSDDSSGAHVVTVNISLEQFSEALLGLAHVPCEFKLGVLKNVGKKREVKTIRVFVPGKSFNSDEKLKAAKQAIQQYEVDGWQGNAEDALNHHNLSKYSKHYICSFCRVDK